MLLNGPINSSAPVNFLCSGVRYCYGVVVFFLSYASKNWALSTFCLRNVPYASLSFKCTPQTMESSREMDEMRRWNGNQSHSGLQMMEEVTTHRPTGKKDSDIRVTWKHDKKLVHMKENWPHSIQCLQAFHINIPVSTNCVQVSTQKIFFKKCKNGTFTLQELMSHVFLFWNLRRRHWSPSPFCPSCVYCW